MIFQELVSKLMEIRWSFTLYNGANGHIPKEFRSSLEGNDIYVLEVMTNDEIFYIPENDPIAIQNMVELLENW